MVIESCWCGQIHRLTDNYRLVTVHRIRHKFFLFAGKYDETDHHIDQNKGKIFTFRQNLEVIGETNVSTKDENFLQT